MSMNWLHRIDTINMGFLRAFASVLAPLREIKTFSEKFHEEAQRKDAKAKKIN
jgi:hypothetical protein